MTDVRLIEATFPLETGVPRLRAREERSPRARLDPAHLAGAAAVGGEPGDVASYAAARSEYGGGAAEAAAPHGRGAWRMRRVERAGDRAKGTQGGILHWGRESTTEGAAELNRFRAEVREAFGGRAPRVLDPFAGGGAIPLEAMRLGCETVAADINPVAWFVLRCTLYYPQLAIGSEASLAGVRGRRSRLRGGVSQSARDPQRPPRLREELARLGHGDGDPVQVDGSDLQRNPQHRAGGLGLAFAGLGAASARRLPS